MDVMQVFGLTGTAGSGKDTVAEILCRLYGMENMSTSDFVRVVTRYIYKQPPDFNPIRDQLYMVANFMRQEFHSSAIVKVGLFQAEELGVRRPLITGLRTMGEAKAVHAASGLLIAVDADPRLRYERIFSRQRDHESKKTYEQFLQQDSYENRGITTQGDGRGIHYIVENADIVIHNNSSLEDLERQIKDKVGPLVS